MGALFKKIRECVIDGRYVVGQHAAERLEERGILEWQVVDGVEDGTLLVERQAATPNPIAEVSEHLADGTEVKAAWSYIISVDTAKLVTVHFYDE